MKSTLEHYKVVALDTETTGLRWPKDHMFGFSITTPEWSAYYDIREQPEAIQWLKDQTRYQTKFVFFNVSFDVKMLWSKGVEFNDNNVDCAAIRACLINEQLGHGQYDLDSLAKRYLGAEKYGDIYRELADMFGGLATKNVQMPRLHRAPPEMVAPYAIRDTELTHDLWWWQEEEIERQNLRQVAEFERRTIRHVVAQERAGIRVDLDKAERTKAELAPIIDREKVQLNWLVGRDFNANSSPQVQNYFNPKEDGRGGYVLADGTPTKLTKKGNPSIDNDVLQSIAHVEPVAAQIIKIRSLIRTTDTFLGKHILESAVKGRVYPNINQVASEKGGTKTGRFSYTAPALQQIPNRNKEIAALIKPCFLPDEGMVWMDGDLNSFEVRIFAHLVAAYNRAIADAYAQDPNIDFHQWVADLMDVIRNPPKEGGANAKQLNLSMIFNSGNGAIAKQLGYPTTPDSFVGEDGKTIHYDKPCPEAMLVINKYHDRIQGVRKLVNVAKATVNERGFLRTMYGRKLRFKINGRIMKAYKASGILIQATAAEINKENWSLIDEALSGRGRLMLNTHDSYSMSVEEGKQDEVWEDVREVVEHTPRPHALRVPLILDKNGVGPNWWEALQG